jgi:hypothetical protein
VTTSVGGLAGAQPYGVFDQVKKKKTTTKKKLKKKLKKNKVSGNDVDIESAVMATTMPLLSRSIPTITSTFLW